MYKLRQCTRAFIKKVATFHPCLKIPALTLAPWVLRKQKETILLFVKQPNEPGQVQKHASLFQFEVLHQPSDGF
jgi:hypothetical protein